MIEHNQTIFSIGSCFSDMIAAKLESYKWSVVSNPFGTLYDPVSIERNIVNSIDKAPISDSLLSQRDDIYFHFYYHSDLSALSLPTLAQHIERAHDITSTALLKAHWAVITLGSAMVYKHISHNEVVANCHKVPQNEFEKHMLNLRKVKSSLQNTINKVRTINPDIKFLLTVSPVRHLRYGMEQNMLSKAILRLACEEITSTNGNTIYFPSFEIMMDELRDYQYYKADKVHPNEVAENHIWNEFVRTMIAPEARLFIEQWGHMRKALAHKPMHSGSNAHQRFIKETLKKLDELSSQVDVSTERRQLESQLI